MSLIPSNFSFIDREEALKQCSESQFLLNMFDDPSRYCLVIRDFSKLMIPFVLGGLLEAFSVFYTFTCVCIFLLYKQLTTQLRNVKDFQDCYRLLHAYEEIVNAIALLDDHLSYSAFVTFLSSMAGIFRVNYALIFAEESYSMTLIYSGISGIMYLNMFLSITLSASAVTEEGRIARDLIISLPRKFQPHYRELKRILGCNFKREVVPTLWKMYTIEKSILISAFGTLLTYGILIATLGNVQIPKN
ncbi:uncharacterized protein NPIL_194601 [Nephila pilipes]|uniref:Gustatory receptor n=1 Tax=Nephila pilipes TaxID=299642 RepID=A0A8X6NZB5_NEPPI|nr:uncharacterized protein NPIL_117371 [Nephila pilipes]GFT34263.1 uncharacterized protein NPIL_550791 [Nephila pilipes]GFT40024.1 uncharacterized protein NPIL_469591 [Nephila pilipes]GFT51056.1 uncharacterized protein NPIL_194601 [Nephila pilipes]